MFGDSGANLMVVFLLFIVDVGKRPNVGLTVPECNATIRCSHNSLTLGLARLIRDQHDDKHVSADGDISMQAKALQADLVEQSAGEQMKR